MLAVDSPITGDDDGMGEASSAAMGTAPIRPCSATELPAEGAVLISRGPVASGTCCCNPGVRAEYVLESAGTPWASMISWSRRSCSTLNEGTPTRGMGVRGSPILESPLEAGRSDGAGTPFDTRSYSALAAIGTCLFWERGFFRNRFPRLKTCTSSTRSLGSSTKHQPDNGASLLAKKGAQHRAQGQRAKRRKTHHSC